LLVNNAGIGPRQRMDMLEISEESMWEVLNVNLVAGYFLTQLAAKAMIALIKCAGDRKPKNR
jgi:3-oxoacyl-[acyl-carrier protein] reductase